MPEHGWINFVLLSINQGTTVHDHLSIQHSVVYRKMYL